MAAAPDELELLVDELYGLPLDAFTPERDKLARERRKAGDRAGADRIKALRKPSVTAWALNQVQRHDRARVDELLSAGEQLREAQSQLLAGGEHGRLREAVAQERALIDELARLAEHELEQAGHAPSVAVQTKLWQTLQAAARDEHTRELLSQGRLLKDGQTTDLGLGGSDGAFVEQAPATPERAPARPTPAKPARDAARERKLKAARERLVLARHKQDELEQEFDALERAAADARKEADRAHAAADRAGVKARQAAGRTRELETSLSELESRD
jgi:hypothetical protein